jgi:peptide subunit release factor 1 (eRF1)
MLTDNDLRELLEFKSPEPVLSLYLNTEPGEGNADAYKLRLRAMLKPLNLPQDILAIERYFNTQYDWSGRAVAVFSCAAQGFFRAYPLAMPVRSYVHTSDRPSVKPLADLLDAYGGYGVVLVDKQGARLFHFHLGSLREQEGVLGEAVRHVKRGGASSMPGRRGGAAGKTNQMEQTIQNNLKEAVDFAVRFFEEKHIRRVLIGGSDENIAAFRSLLPKAWQSLVMGAFNMPMTASHQDVLNRTQQLGAEAEQRREARLVDDLITLAKKQSGAVLGMEDTFDAINHDRVRTLAVEEGLRQAGYVCNHCGALYAMLEPQCVLCGLGQVQKTVDATEMAVGTVMRAGGEIEVVHTGSELAKSGGIGAFLRY